MTYRDIVGIPDPSKANINSLAINDPDATDLATHAASTAAHNLGATWEEKYVARGLSRSGLTVGQAGVFFEEFTDVARWRKIGGVASLTAVTTLCGGVGQIALVGADHVAYMPGSVAFGNPTVGTGLGRWAMAGRMRLPVAPHGEAVFYAWATLAGGSVGMGYFDGIDLTHGSAQIYDGASPQEYMVSTVVLGNAWHDFELACDSVRYYLSIDDETPIAYTPTNPPTNPISPRLAVFRTPGGITAQYDKFLCVFPQAA